MIRREMLLLLAGAMTAARAFARATEGDAGDRHSEQRIAPSGRADCGRVPSGAE
jgi:hypothetical protein